MGSIIGRLLMSLVGAFGALFGGWRTWLSTILVKSIVIVAVYNLFIRIITESFTWVLDVAGDIDAPGGAVGSISLSSYTQLGAWLVATTKLPECFAFMLACILLKWSLRRIPFLRW